MSTPTLTTDSQLADFLENKLIPEVNKRRNKPVDFSHWIRSLRNNSVVGSHQWRNLAVIIYGYSISCGINARNYFDYCSQRGNY